VQETEELKVSLVGATEEPELEYSEQSSLIDWEYVRRNVELLYAHRRFLVKFVVAGLVFWTALAFLLPKKYQSTVMLMPPDSSSSSPLSMLAGAGMMSSGGGSGGGMGAAGAALGAMGSSLGSVGDLLGLKSPGQLYVQALSSHKLEDRMIDRFNLMSVYKRKYRWAAREKLEKNTDADEDKKSGVVTITVTDADPKRAAEMANAYVQELDNLIIGVSKTAAAREREFLQGQIGQSKKDLDESAQALSEFSSKNATLNIEDQARAMVEAGAQLEGQLIAAQAGLRGMEQIYSENNPRVQQTRAGIAELQSQIRKLGGTEKSLKQAGTAQDELYPPLRKLPILSVQYMDLYRRAKVREAVYGALVESYELARLDECRDVGKLRVLDPGDVPEKKSSPHRLIIMIFGTFLSITLAMGWVMASDWWETTPGEDPRHRLLEPLANKLFRSHAHPRLS
jgi:capsule polysaccharide export protein KpsE/RkpR